MSDCDYTGGQLIALLALISPRSRDCCFPSGLNLQRRCSCVFPVCVILKKMMSVSHRRVEVLVFGVYLWQRAWECFMKLHWKGFSEWLLPLFNVETSGFIVVELPGPVKSSNPGTNTCKCNQKILSSKYSLTTLHQLYKYETQTLSILPWQPSMLSALHKFAKSLSALFIFFFAQVFPSLLYALGDGFQVGGAMWRPPDQMKLRWNNCLSLCHLHHNHSQTTTD